jgi:histidine triad (HIT) family protein
MSAPTNYAGDDFYCDVALRDPGQLDIVFDSDRVLAYHHTRPHWPVHIVVVPKTHVPSLTDLAGADEALLRELLIVVQGVAATVERDQGAAAVLTNLGRYQDSKHLHVHVSSGDPVRPD